MAKYIANIELQNANKKDHDKLNKELQKENFIAEKHAAKSGAYITSKKVFSKEGKVTLLEVNKAVAKAVARIGKEYSFFIVKEKYVVNI